MPFLTFPQIDKTDERAIEKWNHAVNVELLQYCTNELACEFVPDFEAWKQWLYKAPCKPKPLKCTCPLCGGKHNLKR